MKKLFLFLALMMSAGAVYAQEDGRPKMKELGEKRTERLRAGSKCMEKKGLWGFADIEDKFVIPAIFSKVEPFNDMGIAFVSYPSAGRTRWTPISIEGVYLTGLEFDEPGVYDAAGFAKVVQGGKYGMIDRQGKLVVECKYPQVEEFAACYVFHGPELKPLALVHDSSDKGCSLKTFEHGQPIVLTAAQKCGIVSPETFELVAPFEFDAYQVIKDFYLLTASLKKAVYSRDRLSDRYDDVVLSSDTTYFVTRNLGRYGAMNFSNEVLLPCELEEAPQLGPDYRLFTLADGTMVFSTDRRMITLKAYDELLRDSCMKTPSGYVLDTLIPYEHKQYIPLMLETAYGTKEFAPLRDRDDARAYAVRKRLFMLSKGAGKSAYYDVDLKKAVPVEHSLERNFSVDGYPAFVTVVENGGKKGLLDIRTDNMLLPCTYDRFEPMYGNHVVMMSADSLKLYDLVAEKDELADYFHAAAPVQGYEGMIMLTRKGKKGLYDLKEGKWLLPVEYDALEVFRTKSENGEDMLAAEVVNGGVHGIYDITSGKLLVNCIFNDILNTDLKQLHVQEGASYGIYNAFTSEYMVPCTYDEILQTCECFYNELAHSLAVVRSGRYLGLYDLTMKKLVLPTKSFYMHILDGYACVSNGGGYMILDLKTRNNAFTSTFKEAKLLPHGYVIVDQGHGDTPEYGVFNLNVRSWVSEPKKGVRISDLGKGFIGYYGGEEAGIMDYKDGRWICRTDGASEMLLVGDRYAVITADHNFLKGIYDVIERSWLLNQEYEDIKMKKALDEDGNEYDRYALVVNMYSKYGIMDLATKDFVLGSLYEEVDLQDNGVVMVTRAEQKGVFDIVKKDWIVQVTAEPIQLAEADGIMDVKVGETAPFKYDLKKRGPVTAVDYKLPFTSESVDDSYLDESGLLMVSKDGKWGIYDSATQTLVVPCEYLSIESMYKR